MRERLASITREESSALLSNAWRTPPFPPEIAPVTAVVANRLRATAKDQAVLGLGVSREDTLAHVEEWLSDPHTVAELHETYNLNWRTLVPHPDGKTALPLHLIPGIGTPAFSEGHYAIFVPTRLPHRTQHAHHANGHADKQAEMQADMQDGGQEPTNVDTSSEPNSESDRTTLRFYRIYSPTTGTNQGVRCIRRYSSNNEHAITPAEARYVVEAINADPDAAAYRYSDHYANCWVCGRSLTDAVSRLLSVGPICRGFHMHQGLKAAGHEVDRNPERRAVYRRLREWALTQGFTDPRTKEERQDKTITASCVASAWSGVPGVLALGPDRATDMVKAALTGHDLPPVIAEALTQAPADTLNILIDSGVLSEHLFTHLLAHPSPKVRERATAHFTDLLSNL